MANQTESPEERSKNTARLTPKKIAVWLTRLFVALTIGLIAFLLFATFYLRFQAFEIPESQTVASNKSQLGEPVGPVTIRYLGVTGFEISDGVTTIITDPAMNRPKALELISGRLDPDPEIPKKWVPKADFILVNHAHYDHAIDMPEIAKRTGAIVIGTTSVCNLARSRGVPETQIREVNGTSEMTIGTFQLICRSAKHGQVLRQKYPMWGKIPTDAKKLWFFEYTMDGSLTFWLKSNNTTVMHHPSARHRVGQIEGLQADTLIMGINGDPSTPEEAQALIDIVKPKVIVPCHFDNFFQPISAGLSIFPGLDTELARKNFVRDAQTKWVMMDYDQRLKLPQIK